MRRLFLAGLLGLALASCAGSAPAGERRFSGTFDFHFETASFAPDNGGGPYWLSAEGETWNQITAPLTEAGVGPWGRVHIVVEGRLSPEGHYGHLGAYSRELRVTRVIESRLISASREPQGS